MGVPRLAAAVPETADAASVQDFVALPAGRSQSDEVLRRRDVLGYVALAMLFKFELLDELGHRVGRQKAADHGGHLFERGGDLHFFLPPAYFDGERA
jgi:hypothetical protein